MSKQRISIQSPRMRLLAALGAALCALIPFLVIGLSQPPRVYASVVGADWYVSPSGDDTTCTSWATACHTLQGAYDKASWSGGDRIHMAAGTYYEHLDLLKNLTIIGTHPDRGWVTIIHGSAPGAVITIGSGTTISLTGVTINNTQPSSYGGGIYNNGTLEMNDVLLTDITATGYGGGIYNYWKATLYDVTISANTVLTYGAGIYNSGAMTLTDVTIQDNTVSWEYGNGGGIFNSGSIVLSGVVINENTAGYGGGGIHNNAASSAILDEVTLSGNTANSFGGGGIINDGDLTLTDVTLDHNSALRGGGLYNYTNGDAFLMNVTLSDNEAGAGGGGGIYNYLGTITIINSTIAYNDISSGSGVGGVVNSSGTLNMDNSIIAFNENLNCDGTISSDFGRNLNNVAEDYSCDSDEDLIGYDPLLGPLQNNGGKTRTHDLGRGSQAIDNGDNSGYVCADYDQRGFKRPINGTCDIGAVEYGWVVYLPLVRR